MGFMLIQSVSSKSLNSLNSAKETEHKPQIILQPNFSPLGYMCLPSKRMLSDMIQAILCWLNNSLGKKIITTGPLKSFAERLKFQCYFMVKLFMIVYDFCKVCFQITLSICVLIGHIHSRQNAHKGILDCVPNDPIALEKCAVYNRTLCSSLDFEFAWSET